MKFHIILSLFVAMVLFSCKTEKEVEDVDTRMDEPTVTMTTAKADLTSKSGSKVKGSVTFKTLDDGTIMYNVTVTGLDDNSTHAIHLHETGDCSADDATSAGGHWNPTGHDHGKLGKGEDFHLGDIGNLDASDDGTASMSGTTDKWSMESGKENSIIGKAVIIHAGADDFTSQPSGNAGSRIACGVVQ